MNQHNQPQSIEMATLQQWLEQQRNVVILDVRPLDQRQEWAIPDSIHADVYNQLKAEGHAHFQDLNLPKETPIVTVCAAGRVSQLAASQLAQEGYQVFSLQGGMNAWSQAWNVARWPLGEDITILQVRRTGKGCLSYVIGSQGEALVIDPSVEVHVYEQLAKENNWRITNVVETHLHADHLSRARLLSQKTGGALVLPVGDERQYPYQPISSGESLAVDSMSVQALSTPGHTPHSFSYWLESGVLFTGDTLFTDGVGRPDLHSQEPESRDRAALLHQSLQKLLSFPDDTVVLPGHTSQAVGFDGRLISATIGQLKQTLPMLQLEAGDFINQLLSRIPPTPANYTLITERNATGYFFENDPLDLEVGANRCAVS